MQPPVAAASGKGTATYVSLHEKITKTYRSFQANPSTPQCVQAVGNINTYTSYISNTTRTRTSLASTMNLNATRTANHSTTNLFWSFPSDLTTASTWTPDSAYLASLATYTLCDQVNSVYNITDDDLTDEMYHDEVWLSEYERVCYPPVNGSFPTTGFNFSIILTDDPSMGSSTVFTSSQTASPHASSTVTTATSTTVATPTSTISENGLCGPSNSDWTCLGSQFGDCCSNYGYCGSSSEYCSSANCNAKYGSCG